MAKIFCQWVGTCELAAGGVVGTGEEVVPEEESECPVHVFSDFASKLGKWCVTAKESGVFFVLS